MDRPTRRTFLAASAASAERILGANDRIRVGCIGVGMNGSRMAEALARWGAGSPSAPEVAGVADIYRRRKDWARATLRLAANQVHHDYHDLIGRSDLDAVFISVPDHWHRQMTLDAMAAGKDVYLQKPMTLTIEEAREITEAANRLGRVVQVGSQHLSDRRYHVAREIIAAGDIGTLLWAQSTYSRNSLEGEWNYFIEPDATPETIDWKRWLGPAPNRPFSAERYFRWRKYWDYSGGIATDLFYHRLGPLLFAMGPQFPTRVSASGGIYFQKDREVPDTYSTVVEYPDFYISISGSLANAAAQKYLPQVIYGHKGSIVIEEKQVRMSLEPEYTPAGAGKTHAVEQGDLNHTHTQEFFACMRTRTKPTLNAEFGYQIMAAIRLGVDSYRQGRLMLFDPKLEKVSGRSPVRPAYQGDGRNHPKARKTVCPGTIMRYCPLFFLSALLGAQSPESIRPAGSMRLVGVVHDDRALNGAHDVEVQGNVAFVAGKGGGVAFIHVGDPARPRLLASLVDSVEFEDAETVLPHGNVLYLGARDFFAVDIRNPAQPKVLKKVADRPRIDRINSMSLWRNYVFAANKNGFICVFDVSRPHDPVLHDVLDTRTNGGLNGPHAIEALRDHIIVANADRKNPVQVRLYRITDMQGNLLPAGEWRQEGSAPSERDVQRDWALNGANRVVVWDKHAAIGAFVPDRVALFEMPEPGKLVQIANMPVCDIDATGMAIAGRILFVAGGECAEAIDVSDPSRPVSVAQYRGGALFPTRAIYSAERKTRYDNGHDLTYRDGFLFVTAQNDNRLGILQIIDSGIVRKAATR